MIHTCADRCALEGTKPDEPRLAHRPSKPTVLIVDELDALAETRLRIGLSGYRLRVARSVGEAHERLRVESLPDLIVVNGVLPDGDGFELLGALRGGAHGTAPPIVMLTAQPDPAQFERALSLGASGCLAKPYSACTLAKVLEALLPRA